MNRETELELIRIIEDRVADLRRDLAAIKELLGVTDEPADPFAAAFARFREGARKQRERLHA